MSEIKNRCQHCGEEVPYHGPWKEPKDITPTDHGMHIIFTRKDGGMFVGTVAVIEWDNNTILINSQISSNMPLDDVVKWMPAPA